MLLGASKLKQLEQNITIVHKGVLDKDILQECDDVWAELAGNRAQYNR
jgi:aryl-alcohol dehydrogenase-like predicted oxidoreductase